MFCEEGSQRMNLRKNKKQNRTEQKKRKGERMQEFILTYPSGVSSEEGNKCSLGDNDDETEKREREGEKRTRTD